MPIYKYRCLNCGHKFEFERGMNEVLEIRCPLCESDKINQVFFAIPIHYHCTGFYVTDSGWKKSWGDEIRKLKSEKQNKGNKNERELIKNIKEEKKIKNENR